MEGIKIPPDLLAEFRTGSAGPGGSSVNGSGDAPAGAGIASLEKSLAWLMRIGDDFAKDRELPGLGKMSADDFAELWAIVIERNWGNAVSQSSPEILCAVTTAGIIGANLVAARRVQEKNEKAAEDDKESKK